MARGFADTRKRKRRQIWWRILKWMFVLGMIGAGAVYAYETGSMLAAQEVVVLQQEITQLSGQVRELEDRNQKLNTSVAVESNRVADWATAYRRDVPSGELKKLYAQMQKKTAAGVASERLAFVIAQVQNQRQCDDKVESKRFIVRTPLYKGANDAVTFAKRTITVTALGESAVSANGSREAWFDKAKPVTVHFTLVGGKVSSATGKLPLHHSMVIGNTEHRFTLNFTQGNIFATVTYNTCVFP